MSKGGSSGLRFFADRPVSGQSGDNELAEESRPAHLSSEIKLVVSEDDPETAMVQASISPQALRLIYEQLLADDPKVVNFPKLFLENLLDLIVAAKVDPRDGPAKFLHVFEACKEKEYERSESQKVLFIPRLAYWLEGVRFSRSMPEDRLEHEWSVFLCRQQDLLDANPNVTAITKGVVGHKRDMVPLYEVFCGLKVS